jgi:hypothetical protein
LNYSVEQYTKLSERFNKNSFTGKLILIKQNPNLFKLELDDGNFFLRLKDDKAMEKEIDFLFSFPQNLEDKELKDLFNLIDIKL